jgi:hypothetical protein
MRAIRVHGGLPLSLSEGVAEFGYRGDEPAL